jgi:DNA-binding transcriptional MerR regulator
VRSRIGYYGPEHVARLRLIQEMQADGLKLSAIQRLIGEHGQSAERFVGLRQAITAPFETEAPEVLSVEELAERFGAPVDEKALEKAVKLGVPRSATGASRPRARRCCGPPRRCASAASRSRPP